MSYELSTNVRVLGLFFELLTAERGRTKQQIRHLLGYEGLSESAFESQFQRDKDALRDVGIVLDVGADERYRVADSSFAAVDVTLDDTDISLIHMAIQAWNGQDLAFSLVEPKLAASTNANVIQRSAGLTLDLSGATTVANLTRAIAERRVVSFLYGSVNGLFERAVSPWRLIVRGRALYLWGQDFDRDDDRLFRISRFRSEVSFLGEPGDALPAPETFTDPFTELVVSPILAVSAQATGPVVTHSEALEVESPDLGPDWTLMRGEEAELGEWISAVLQQADRVIVVEPKRLKDAVLARLNAAARWEDRHA
ncbi:helix-turn-helix transcriptional regulator [Schaalia vaccimaxillae]|uniref:helix-turn-helix transcriptional regulator n=1 Tax=Schaalia vaccimaxillae TaxID=183916 RepID=UPI0003B541F0|nr:WYL domain-containing protein [Schaalia vaccimaxillae]